MKEMQRDGGHDKKRLLETIAMSFQQYFIEEQNRSNLDFWI